MNRLALALVQHAASPDPARNVQQVLSAVREAAGRGVQLVLLQELHNTLYFCQREDPDSFDLAEPIPGPSTEALAQLAAELQVVIVGSLFERRTAGLYHNTAVVLDADGRLAGTTAV